MDPLLVAGWAVAAAALVAATVAARRAGAERRRADELEQELRRLRAQLEAGAEPEPQVVEEPQTPDEPQAADEPEPPEPEPVPEAEPEPEPAPAPAEPAVDDRVRRHAAHLVREAHQMARFLDFDAMPDAKNQPTVYRITLDLKPAVNAEAAGYLTQSPFACVKEFEVRGQQGVLLVDVSVDAP